MTNNCPEGHLGDLRAGTCQASADTVARKCLEALAGVLSGVIVSTVVTIALAKMCLEEPSHQPQALFFPRSGQIRRKEVIWVDLTSGPECHTRPCFPVTVTMDQVPLG